MMPVMDGLEATRCIRRLEKEKHQRKVPISALTANSTMLDQEACLKAGMDSFISKPCSAEKLYKCLLELEKVMDYDDL